MSINCVSLTGRLVRPVELKQTQTGVAVCNFCIAVDRAYKSGEERQADFIDCVAWRGTAEFIQKYFGKGDMIGLTGKLQTRMWEDKEGGKRKAVEVLVSEVSFVGGKKSGAESENAMPVPDGEDFPF